MDPANLPKSILIIGSGVFGLSTAYSLAKNDVFKDANITLIDRSDFPAPDAASVCYFLLLYSASPNLREQIVCGGGGTYTNRLTHRELLELVRTNQCGDDDDNILERAYLMLRLCRQCVCGTRSKGNGVVAF